MATKAEIMKELDAKGIPFDSNATKPELEELLPDASEDEDVEEQDEESTLPVKGGMYYHLKMRSYVNDEEIWDVGLYHTKKAIERLDNSSPAYVVRYEGELPEVVVYEVAQKLMINTQGKGGKLRPAKEIMEEVVIER